MRRDSPLILLVRHGRTTLNKSGKLRAWEDVPLDRSGELDATMAIPKLAPFEPKFVYSSDFVRDTQTGDIIAAGLQNIPRDVDYAFRTADMGELSGQDEDAVRDRVLRWYQNPWEPAPSGESYGQFLKRFMPAFEEKLEMARSIEVFRPTIIVTHGRNIAALHSRYAMLRPEEGLMPFPGGIALVNEKFDGMDSLEFIEEAECVCEDK